MQYMLGIKVVLLVVVIAGLTVRYWKENCGFYIRHSMNVIFESYQYFTKECSKGVKYMYCFPHQKKYNY